jgi:hypothetical protein
MVRQAHEPWGASDSCLDHSLCYPHSRHDVFGHLSHGFGGPHADMQSLLVEGPSASEWRPLFSRVG